MKEVRGLKTEEAGFDERTSEFGARVASRNLTILSLSCVLDNVHIQNMRTCSFPSHRLP